MGSVDMAAPNTNAVVNNERADGVSWYLNGKPPAGHQRMTSRKQKARRGGRAFVSFNAERLFAVAEQLQQHQEQVDEVEVEAQGAHDGLLGGNFTRVAFVVHFLDLLGVVGGQAGKHQNTDHGDGELQGGGGQEDVHQRSDDDTDQAHEQERAPSRTGLSSWCSRRGSAHRKKLP